ncbi:transaldolase [Paracidobacterium acidisoli]|uniref:Transaldolase n=1 Tax=Paracidobacterium acidisoli TaxID=2303751 RepID=A0A372IT10_9BACT|nr:transaldolase [Paracidobacterium acidisoli]MBT9329485.1 transaldolase [Paracidobacterium acidisoli]
MPRIEDLTVKLFSDGADMQSILRLSANPWIRGFTTNPTLMRKAGVADYENFGRALLRAIPDRPVSLEVFADDEDEMEDQALTIAGWGPNVNIKIPITNRQGIFPERLIRRLSSAGVTLNITAILTLDQVKRTVDALAPSSPAIVSVFAGRIADTGIDPVPVMRAARELLSLHPGAELLWASPRELLNVFQANDAGCHIITVPSEMLQKLSLIGKDLTAYSLETVDMFYQDARAAEYRIRSAVMQPV